MKLCAMRFCGHTWHHNPKSLEISSGKKVVQLQLPYADDVVKSFGEKPVKIKGVAELYGEDCLLQYEKLKKIYEKGECSVLCLPKLPPLYACFESLTLVATSKKDVLTYSFAFTEYNKERKIEYVDEYVTAKEGQTLFHIANECDVNVEKLVELNPQIMFINDLKAGERVRVC